MEQVGTEQICSLPPSDLPPPINDQRGQLTRAGSKQLISKNCLFRILSNFLPLSAARLLHNLSISGKKGRKANISWSCWHASKYFDLNDTSLCFTFNLLAIKLSSWVSIRLFTLELLQGRPSLRVTNRARWQIKQTISRGDFHPSLRPHQHLSQF